MNRIYKSFLLRLKKGSLINCAFEIIIPFVFCFFVLKKKENNCQKSFYFSMIDLIDVMITLKDKMANKNLPFCGKLA